MFLRGHGEQYPYRWRTGHLDPILLQASLGCVVFSWNGEWWAIQMTRGGMFPPIIPMSPRAGVTQVDALSVAVYASLEALLGRDLHEETTYAEDIQRLGR
jgi:hypothetical protein